MKNFLRWLVPLPPGNTLADFFKVPMPNAPLRHRLTAAVVTAAAIVVALVALLLVLYLLAPAPLDQWTWLT